MAAFSTHRRLERAAPSPVSHELLEHSHTELGIGQHEVVECPGHSQFRGRAGLSFGFQVERRLLGPRIWTVAFRKSWGRIGSAGRGLHVRGIDIDGFLLTDDFLPNEHLVHGIKDLALPAALQEPFPKSADANLGNIRFVPSQA